MFSEYSCNLKNRIAIYVPSTINVNKEIDTSFYVNTIAEKFSDFFGGATAIQASGFWISEKIGLVAEKVTIVYAFSDTTILKKHEQDIINLCNWLKTELSQEAISLECNNELYFI